MDRLMGLLGVVVLIGFGVILSEHRGRISWRLVVGGVLLQLAMAWLLLVFEPAVRGFEYVAQGVNAVVESADAGIGFVYGELGDPTGTWGYVFAFRALSVIIFFASLMAVLYHIGIMQRLIAGLAWVLKRTLRVTGTEALAMAANVFVGQTEAPLCIKPYIEKMTRSQIMTLMTGGFATIAGSVLAAYVGMLGGIGPEHAAERVAFAKHLLIASILSAPAAFVMAKIMVPETETPIDEGLKMSTLERPSANMLDAAAMGAADGLKLALNVGAMLIAFVSILALVNMPLAALGDAIGIESLSLQMILGALFQPLAWTMGVPWSESEAFGSLLGQKVILTEFFAYGSLAEMIQGDEPVISMRTAQMAAYALCGFANLPSIGIQIGGLTAIAPGRRSVLVELGFKAMMAGAMASWMTASIAGMFLERGV